MTEHLPMPQFGPLAGVRVVFSGIEIAGPFAGQMFAEWGAEVIWIENVATLHGRIPFVFNPIIHSFPVAIYMRYR